MKPTSVNLSSSDSAKKVVSQSAPLKSDATQSEPIPADLKEPIVLSIPRTIHPLNLTQNNKSFQELIDQYSKDSSLNIQKEISLASYKLIAKINPENKDFVVYCPEVDSYFVPILAATDATTFIYSNQERCSNSFSGVSWIGDSVDYIDEIINEIKLVGGRVESLDVKTGERLLPIPLDESIDFINHLIYAISYDGIHLKIGETTETYESTLDEINRDFHMKRLSENRFQLYFYQKGYRDDDTRSAILNLAPGRDNTLELSVVDLSVARAEIKFWFPRENGDEKLRTLIYYTGIDKNEFLPNEIKDGYDVLWLNNISANLPHKTKVENDLIASLKDNGSIIFNRSNIAYIKYRFQTHNLNTEIVGKFRFGMHYILGTKPSNVSNEASLEQNHITEFMNKILLANKSKRQSISRSDNPIFHDEEKFIEVYDVLPKINPDGKDLKVYYPACGLDLVSVLASTDATTLIFSDLSRDFCKRGDLDNFKGIIEQLKVMDSRIDELYIPPNRQEGRGVIKFWLPSSKGDLKLRTLIYYSGVDATKFIPPEIEDGFDVLWASSAPIFRHKKGTNEKVLELLNKNGFAYVEHVLNTKQGYINALNKGVSF